MTAGGNNFNDFPENQLTKFCVVVTVLRQIGTMRSFVKARLFQIISFAYFDSRPLMSMTVQPAGDRSRHISMDSVF